MVARIKFSADIYIEGDNIKDIRDKWIGTPLFSKEALECNAQFSELLLVEDDNTYKDLLDEFHSVI